MDMMVTVKKGRVMHSQERRLPYTLDSCYEFVKVKCYWRRVGANLFGNKGKIFSLLQCYK